MARRSGDGFCALTPADAASTIAIALAPGAAAGASGGSRAVFFLAALPGVVARFSDEASCALAPAEAASTSAHTATDPNSALAGPPCREAIIARLRVGEAELAGAADRGCMDAQRGRGADRMDDA